MSETESVLDLLAKRPSEIKRPPVLPAGSWVLRARNHVKFADPFDKIRDDYKVEKVARVIVEGVRPLESVDTDTLEALDEEYGLDGDYAMLTARWEVWLKRGAEAQQTAAGFKTNVGAMLDVDIDEEEQSLFDLATTRIKGAVFIGNVEVRQDDKGNTYADVKGITRLGDEA